MIHLRPQVVEGCEIKVAVTPHLRRVSSLQRHTTINVPEQKRHLRVPNHIPSYSVSHSLYHRYLRMIYFTLPKHRLGDLTSLRCELDSAARSGIFDQDFFARMRKLLTGSFAGIMIPRMLEMVSSCAWDVDARDGAGQGTVGITVRRRGGLGDTYRRGLRLPCLPWR